LDLQDEDLDSEGKDMDFDLNFEDLTTSLVHGLSRSRMPDKCSVHAHSHYLM